MKWALAVVDYYLIALVLGSIFGHRVKDAS